MSFEARFSQEPGGSPGFCFWLREVTEYKFRQSTHHKRGQLLEVNIHDHSA